MDHFSHKPDLSFVIPVVERYGDLERLQREYSAEVNRLGKSAEYIFVVDDRQREALPSLKELQTQAVDTIVLIVLSGQFGESTSLMIGVDHSRADIIVTLASYFQVAPSGLEESLRKIEEDQADLVVGRRIRTEDSWLNRFQSSLFHLAVRLITSTNLRDISCGFRVMRREVPSSLKIYGGLHRFIPILADRYGFAVVELPLPQRTEDVNPRFYGVAIYLKRLLDILTVFFLIRFTQRPLRFFGLVGGGLASTGMLITAYLGIHRLLRYGPIADRPLLLLGVLLIVLGIQFLSIGLLGEVIVFTHSKEVEVYRIAEIIQDRPPLESKKTDRLDPSESSPPQEDEFQSGAKS